MDLRSVIRGCLPASLIAIGLSFSAAGNAQVPSRFIEHSISRPIAVAAANTSAAILSVAGSPGEDISLAVGSALSAVKTSCGTVVIQPGWYTWRTTGIQMNPCQTLIGTSVTILVDPQGATASPFLIVKGPGPMVPNQPVNTTLTVGNIRGITFVGPAIPSSQESSTGIQLGGSTSAETAQLINLYDVHIRNFGCGINIKWAFQIAVFGGSIEGNYDGVCFANIIAGLENLNFHGTQILNNIDYGINQNQTGANTELNLISCSLDYNGQNQLSGGQVQIANGKLIVIGGHFENNRLPMITIPAPGAPAVVNVFVTGAAFNFTDTRTAETFPSFFSVKGYNDVVELGRGVSFISQGASVDAVVDWQPIINGNSRLLFDPYTYAIVSAAHNLPAFIGTAPNSYSFPTYDRYDNVIGMSRSY